jgi:predicted TIM-barrel enzyme
MPSLMDICRSAISDLMADIEVRRAILLSEDEFIEHCDSNDVFFNADGILVNGEIY